MKNIDQQVAGIILAAGKGSRMQSNLPKVLHLLDGKPLLERVYDTLKNVGIQDICLVLSSETAPFEGFLASHPNTAVCIQKNRLGTADAVAAAHSAFKDAAPAPYSQGQLVKGRPSKKKYVLICYGDTPCLEKKTLSEFVSQSLAQKKRLSVIGMIHPEPTGYGRIIRDKQGAMLKIVEEKDASDEERKVNLCNTGIVFAEISFLYKLLSEVNNVNAQGEFYLTDCFKLSKEAGEDVFVYETDQYRSFDGVNTPQQLQALVQWFKSR